MLNIIVALAALAAIAIPALAQAAGQQSQAAPVKAPVSTPSGTRSSTAAGRVVTGDIVVTKRLDKASAKLFSD